MGTLARGEGPLISLGYLKRVTLALATGCDSPVSTTPSPRNRPCSVRWFPSGSAWAGSMRTRQAAQTKLEARSGVPLERQAGSPSKIRHVVDEHQARRPPAERLEKLRLDGQVHGAGPGRPLHAGLVDPVLPLDPALDLGCQEQQAESRLRPVPRRAWQISPGDPSMIKSHVAIKRPHEFETLDREDQSDPPHRPLARLDDAALRREPSSDPAGARVHRSVAGGQEYARPG